MDFNIHISHIAETDSTNLELVRMAPTPATNQMIVAWADYQRAGRGQKGASWESEKGKNLLFSVMLWPEDVEVCNQFVLSEAMSLAICETLCEYNPDFKIKWPNDIYYKEQKLSGTIIETTLRGHMVGRCILGVGINLNQTCFQSDAPNPISLCQIVGHEVDPESVLQSVLKHFAANCQLLNNGQYTDIQQRYHQLMMRREGLFAYRDKEGLFEASLVEIEANGQLVLRDTEDKLRRYMFKEVKHVFKHLERE